MHNGHEYVDLGLTSKTKWAKMNVGASSEKEAGLYFAWGETTGYTASQVGTSEGKKAFKWSDYKFNPSGDGSTFTKYNETDGKTVLDLEDDAAHVNWGGDWHMPNLAQCLELFLKAKNGYVTNTGDFTQFYWNETYSYLIPTSITATISGWDTAGYFFFKGSGNMETEMDIIITSGEIDAAITSGEYLFIPAAGGCVDGGVNDVGSVGLVLASLLNSVNVNKVGSFFVSSGEASLNDYNFERYGGLSVRGVVGQMDETTV